MSFVHPEYLVTTAWLQEHLRDADLRILDCSTTLRPDPEGGSRVESGREAWALEHIPGSGFADLVQDLSDRNSSLRFMMPSAEQFTEEMSRLGVGQGTRAVLYDASTGMWAARVWWMLRAFGFGDAAVLDGGLRKWKLESRPTSNEPPTYPRGHFVARPRPGMIVGKEEVLGAIGQGATCIVDTLNEQEYHGAEGARRYGRPGHIPSSVNVPAQDIVNPETNAYLPADVLREKFAAVGATSAERVITYCGGGIAASSDAFILTLLGHENVAVYDASMWEWAADPSLPMEVG